LTVAFPSGSFPNLVHDELSQARKGHPPMTSLHEGYAILLEEVDELWDEIKLKPRKRSRERLIHEVVQVGAMAARLYEDVIEPMEAV
jgi:hypothetical protein